MNRKYESIVIFNSSLSEAAVKEEIKKVEKFLETNSAQGLKTENWGRKPIAYFVDKQNYGIFVHFNFESGNHEITNQLNAMCRITDTIIKYQSHRLVEKVRKFKGNPKRKPSGFGDDDFSDSSMGDF